MEPELARHTIHTLLRLLISRGGSDLFLTCDFPAAIKIDGVVTKVSTQPLSAGQTQALAQAIMGEHHSAEFARSKECNFALAAAGIGRFRCSAFVQQGQVGLVLRVIPSTPPTIDGLGLPPILKEVAMARRGLCLLVGATGAGKSTTLAALIDWRNTNSQGHIISLEDPIEFIHPHKGCVVTQREIGVDTDSWGIALKNALRQAPDVVLMGEIRDAQTMKHAIAFSETGHLCLATLHATSANQALDRILSFFPKDQQAYVLRDLSLNLQAIVSQRLLPRQSGRGRFAAIEVMLASPLVSELVAKGEVSEIKEVMKKSRNLGMQTFDQALFDGYEDEAISYEEALHNADSRNDLRLRIKLHGKRLPAHKPTEAPDHLSLS